MPAFYKGKSALFYWSAAIGGYFIFVPRQMILFLLYYSEKHKLIFIVKRMATKRHEVMF